MACDKSVIQDGALVERGMANHVKNSKCEDPPKLLDY